MINNFAFEKTIPPNQCIFQLVVIPASWLLKVSIQKSHTCFNSIMIIIILIDNVIYLIGCQLGTSHPPGYPLYTILVHLVTKFGPKLLHNTKLSPAYFVNLMSAFFGALTSGFVSAIVFLLTNDCDFCGENTPTSRVTRLACLEIANAYVKASTAIMVGLLYSFSPLAWQYSTTAEVFALHG